MPRPSLLQRLAIPSLCFLAIAPFFWFGSPSGHDFEFHMLSWMDVQSQWRQGVAYPPWAAGAHFGYGEPRFLFYPPASWMLGAGLGSLLPWKMVPGAYCWFALTIAGTAMFALARRWLPLQDALFAAAFYALNPYHLLIVYWRSAYAELLAAALLPLLLLCMLRLNDASFRPTLWLSLVLAAAWLTNDPAAMMIHYSAAGLAFVLAMQERSLRPLWRTACAAIPGGGLAAFYLLPALYEERWVNIGEVLSPGVRPQDNFLFTTLADPDHNRFNLLVSLIALGEMAVLIAAIFFSLRRRVKNTLWTLSAIWGTAAAFATFSFTDTLWKYLPKFRYVQLPFRWLLCMNVALAILMASATLHNGLRRWAVRVLVAATLLAIVIFAGQKTQPPWWDTGVDIDQLHQAVVNGTGYEGVDEYVPAGADSYEVKKDLPKLSDESGTPVPATAVCWNGTEKQCRVFAKGASKLTVRLFNYPAWRVTVNGHPVEAARADVTGLMIVPLQAGQNDIEIRFVRTSDRIIGDIVSLLSLVVFALAWIRTSRTSRATAQPGNQSSRPRTVLVATSNAGKLRDFAGAAAEHGIAIAPIPGFSSLPPAAEDGSTFEANARKKAEQYSRAVPGELVIADDSGLEVDALNGAPGVHSARYAAPELQGKEPHAADSKTDDEANNARLLRELAGVTTENRTARFVCVIAAARDGKTLNTFRGTADGIILDSPRGTNGFGYDPLFYFPQIGKTFAELSAGKKSRYSHRGAAFRAFLAWFDQNGFAFRGSDRPQNTENNSVM